MIASFFRFLWAMIRVAWYRLCGGVAVIAPPEVVEERRKICSCCVYENDDGVCEICSCFTAAKTLLSVESCPHKPPYWKSSMKKPRKQK